MAQTPVLPAKFIGLADLAISVCVHVFETLLYWAPEYTWSYDPTKPYPTNDQIFNALAAQLSILDLWPLIVRAMPRCKPDPVWVEKLKEGWWVQ